MVTSCGRALLKAINSHVLPPPPQWALEHPQAEQETALERIETMTTYRACHALAARCAKAGAKPTRMLGRGFLRGTRCLETVSDSCRAQLLEQRSFGAQAAKTAPRVALQRLRSAVGTEK